ncbi:unnamed protein product [Protopolystoma xenopodis]|uniref:Potassium channel domain-containing protein n=1 Tax=Protopolystoma xenopodis TaxID=117903 RepID=A0A3S5BGE9_9PLAT|nr:unnamed protein product [Protopolystoma xenopodis]
MLQLTTTLSQFAIDLFVINFQPAKNCNRITETPLGANWNIINAIYFCATVVTTIGEAWTSHFESFLVAVAVTVATRLQPGLVHTAKWARPKQADKIAFVYRWVRQRLRRRQRRRARARETDLISNESAVDRRCCQVPKVYLIPRHINAKQLGLQDTLQAIYTLAHFSFRWNGLAVRIFGISRLRD